MKLPQIPLQRDRQITHVIMALLSVMACIFTYFLKPDATFARIVTIGLGYLALAQVIVTLLIGPVKLLLKASLKRNPVNIYLRRDLGIWAGINGATHVAFGLQVHRGGDIVQYYFERIYGGELRLLSFTNAFGFSNYTGGLAIILILLLLFISNDLSVELLRGPTWKWIQRANYILAALTIAHTFGYQIEVQRPLIMTVIVIGLTIITIVAQLTGIAISMIRRPAKLETKTSAERGLWVAAVVMVIVPILLVVCLSGLWLYDINTSPTLVTFTPSIQHTPHP